MQLTPEQKLDRLLITREMTFNGKRVYRDDEFIYIVDGVRIVRRRNESEINFTNRLLYAITEEACYLPRPVNEAKRQAHIAQARAHRESRKHPCAGCGKMIDEKSTRCRKCDSKHKRQYAYVPCKVCGEECAPYRTGGRGGRKMLNRAGVCMGCARDGRDK